MIKPTIGRVVLVFTVTLVGDLEKKLYGLESQPHPAFITYVHDDRTINVAGFDSIGRSFAINNIQLLQDDDQPEDDQHYAAWMPYQIQAAAAQEAKVSSPLGTATIASNLGAIAALSTEQAPALTTDQAPALDAPAPTV